MQQIEGHELGLRRVLAGERRVQGEEVRDAILAEDRGLAVNDGRAAGKVSILTMPGMRLVQSWPRPVKMRGHAYLHTNS
jgi:hypothetical protein